MVCANLVLVLFAGFLPSFVLKSKDGKVLASPVPGNMSMAKSTKPAWWVVGPLCMRTPENKLPKDSNSPS